MGVSSRVFVVQQPMRRVSQHDIDRGLYSAAEVGDLVPLYDFSPALEYGNLELLIDSNVIVGIATAPLVRSFHQKLKDYSDNDYLLLTGNPVAMGLATAVAAHYNQGRVAILQWDRRARRYIKTESKAW